MTEVNPADSVCVKFFFLVMTSVSRYVAMFVLLTQKCFVPCYLSYWRPSHPSAA